MATAQQLVAVLLLSVSCGTEGLAADALHPAAVHATLHRPMVVAAAHPVAAQAGMDVLKRGGDAVDAAIAIQAMLGLVEPQSSGLGGGAFMLRYDATSRRIDVYDGRETAPAAAASRIFLDPSGHPLARGVAMTSGQATGVPGAVAMLHLAHREHGRLPWSSLFESTALQAEFGFTVGPRLQRFIDGKFPQATTPDVSVYFGTAAGGRLRAGDTLRNPAYAGFVRRLAQQGPAALYQGDTANAIAAKLAEQPLPAVVTLDDLASYRPIKRQPLCGPYHGYQLCSAPPPASGVGLLQLMALLERSDIARRSADDPQAWYLFAEASRLMYADRDAWVGDPAFSKVPTQGLLAPVYIAQRRALIGPRASAAPAAGAPPGSANGTVDATQEAGGTSHFVIVDRFGNAVSMTTTVESFFGSGRMVDGFFLNNQMTDFSFLPEGPNAVAPGKRPRSSMSPLVILDRRGRLVGLLGSPGGNAIPAYVAKTLVGVLDWRLPMQQSIDLPNLVARGAQFNGEAGKMKPELVRELAQRGVTLRSGSGEDSGLHGVLWRSGHWDGGADSRREGVVLFAEVH